jgi:uncharacterized cupredoxin-like copper-binding protein
LHGAEGTRWCTPIIIIIELAPDRATGVTMFRGIAVVLVLGAFANFAHAQGHSGHQSHDTAFGRKGDPKKVSRTIDVDMSDTMRFAPSELTIKQGETIRFRVKNSGKVMHEMVLGTMQDLKAHADMMKKQPGMAHDESSMVHVPPGKSLMLVWQFTKAGEFHYGCLVPGHFEAGMLGTLTVTPQGHSSHKH